MGVAQQFCRYPAIQTEIYCPYHLSIRASLSSRNLRATPPPWISSKVTTSRRCARRPPHQDGTMDNLATLSTTPQTVATMVSPYLLKAHWRNNMRASHGRSTELTLRSRRLCCCMFTIARLRLMPSGAATDVWTRSPLKATRPTHSCSLSHGRMYAVSLSTYF